FPSPEYLAYIERRLKEVYEAGVVSTEDMENLQKDNAASIRVVEGKRLARKATDRLFTIKKAYEYVLSPDSTFRYRKNVLYRYPLGEYLFPNLIFDEPQTTTAKDELMNNYSHTNGIVQSGQKIIDKGEIVDGQTHAVLESLRVAFERFRESPEKRLLVLIGQILFTGLLIFSLMLYLELFRNWYYERRYRRSLLLLFTLVVFYCVITSLNLFNVYVIPYAMIPIIIRVFLDSRTAFMTHLITVLICSITV
ncbi:Cyclic-di-AMP phosphodiesterase PgpH, partial [termite gut metagenome]